MSLRFRWVDCQLTALEKCLTVKMLKAALETLPRSLDDTYARILENISPDLTEIAYRNMFSEQTAVCC